MPMQRMALMLGAFLPAFLSAPAWAVDGWTVLDGPDVSIHESVGNDFPRHDLGELCRRALPGTTASAITAQSACKAQQGRLAGLASHAWNFLPPLARRDCLERASNANGYVYSVVYACVNAATFTMRSREKVARIAEVIARQNGKVPVVSSTVGSIR